MWYTQTTPGRAYGLSGPPALRGEGAMAEALRRAAEGARRAGFESGAVCLNGQN